MHLRRVGIGLAVFGCVVAALAARLFLRPASPSTPNVVLVIGCTVRRDQTTPYGGPAETTPFLARLAAEGTRFDDVVATASWTREAVVGLLTGEPAGHFGMPEPAIAHNRRALPDAAETLAEHLAERGYETLGVSANPNLAEAYGMAQGFASYLGTDDNSFATHKRAGGQGVVRSALAMLDRRSEPRRPFFLQVVLIDAHQPRATRPDERERFRGPGVSDAVAEYRTTLRRTDDAAAALDEGLRQRGYDASDTWFVFVSDHGEGLHEPAHHGGAHGKQMYRSTLSIPWLIRGPGVPAGGVVTGLASGEDLTPTMLGLLGASLEVTGRDWSAQVREAGRTTRERAYALSMFGQGNVASLWTEAMTCQRDFGSVRERIPQGCFDRASDPDAFVPLEDPVLQAELADWRKATLAAGALHDVRVGDAEENTLKQLQELGYVDGE